MAEKNVKGQEIVLIDTNVIVKGAIDLAGNVESAERKIWLAFLRGRVKVAFSDELLSEVLTVTQRLMGKDFASKLRSQIIRNVEVISKEELLPHISRFPKVPREDVIHAALASAANAKYIISNNREFLRSLKDRFKCATPEEFVRVFHL